MAFPSKFKPTLLTMALLAASTQTIAANEQQYQLSAQPLANALTELATQSGKTIFAPSSLVSELKAPALAGTYNLEQALAILLKGTKLEAITDKSGAIVIQQKVNKPTKPAASQNTTNRKKQQKDEIQERIVVVGRATNVDVTAEDLDKIQANDLADIFQYTPSVTVGGSVGIAQKIYLRGFEDTLLNITVDGAPQTGTLFHHVGRVNIEPELLKQVEVQSGAGEATSGFGTIGGAIRFRTKDAGDLLNPDQDFGVLAKAGYFSNDGYKLSLSAFGHLTDNWDLLTSYVWVDRDNMQDGDGADILGTKADQSLAFIKLSGQLTENQYLSLSYEQRQEDGEFGQRPNWRVLANVPLFPAEAERKTFIANYLFDYNQWLNLELSAYHTKSSFKQDRYDRWGLYGAEVKTYGFDLRNHSEFAAHSLTYGIEYRDDTVSSGYLSAPEVWQRYGPLGYFEEQGDVFAFYLQDHYQLTQAMLLSFGARYDKYQMEQITFEDKTDSSDWSFNAGLLYEFSPHLNLSLGYAEAVRGKEVGDAFTLGKHPATVTLAPDLKAENVENQEIGLNYDDGKLRAGIAYYDTTINDVLTDQIGRGPAPQSHTYYENIGKFKADGYELSLGYSMDNLAVDLFYTDYDSKLNGNPVEGYEQIGLANDTGNKTTLNLAYDVSADLEFGWNITNVQALKNIQVLHRAKAIGWIDELQHVNKPGYTTHDLYVRWYPISDDKLKVNLAVMNVFDKHYRSHASVADYSHIRGWENVVGAYEAGRDIRLSVSYRL